MKSPGDWELEHLQVFGADPAVVERLVRGCVGPAHPAAMHEWPWHLLHALHRVFVAIRHLHAARRCRVT